MEQYPGKDMGTLSPFNLESGRCLLLISGRYAAQITNRRTRRPPACDRTGDQPPEDIPERSGQKELPRPLERPFESIRNQVLCLSGVRQPLPPLAQNRNGSDFNSDEKASDRLCRKP